MPHPETFFIKPAQGLRIADPKTGDYLPEGGRLCPRSGYWLRRLKDCDVVESAGFCPPVASGSLFPPVEDQKSPLPAEKASPSLPEEQTSALSEMSAKQAIPKKIKEAQ